MTKRKTEHDCKYDGEIAVMKFKIDEMHKALMGNGKPGLLEKWYNIEGGVKTLKIINAIIAFFAIAISVWAAIS